MSEIKRKARVLEINTNGETLIDFAIKDVKRKFDGEVIDIVIDIGLIIKYLGIKKDKHVIHYYSDKHSILIIKEENEEPDYYVFKVNEEDLSNRIKLFHLTINEESNRLHTFQRGVWENTLRQISETCRRKGSKNAKKKKENSTGNGSGKGKRGTSG